MIARFLGLVVVVAGGVLVLRAKRITDWTFRINRDWFGWEGGKFLRLYGLAVTVASGLIVMGAGITLVVQGSA